ncbi:MAG: hypothetical protein LBH25_10760 [Fibromonadaceae bacterium]|nr:hypothetical protein [Fibromonadaceae bacterium]
MFRSIIFLLFLCAMFLACSSDDSASLKEWFGDQGKAVSYAPECLEKDIVVDSVVVGFNESAYMVSDFAVLGRANGVEHTLYFGLAASNPIKPTWTFRTDSLFYKIFYDGKFSFDKEVAARFSWRVEGETDGSWLDSLSTGNWEEADTTFIFKADSFTIDLPKKMLSTYTNQKPLNLIIGLTLLEESDMLLRIAPLPALVNKGKEGFTRIAQQSKPLEDCNTCLYAGVRDSAKIYFDMSDVGMLGKTVVSAQLVLPKTDEEAKSEFNYPIPFYVYGEDYSFNAPNLLFLSDGSDSIELQVTRGLRRYGSAARSPGTLDFVLRFGYPKPNHLDSLYFYPRPDYIKYDFAALKGKNAKLKLWLADYGSQK